MATPIPVNTAQFSLGEIFGATHGEVRGELSWEALRVSGVCTDTRALVPGQAFVALVGERFDGHEHLAAAQARGAVVALVEREVAALPGLTTVRVASTRAALGALAAAHLTSWRSCGDRPVVALTGSAGKTTTKRAIAALLEVIFPRAVHRTSGNLNNLVGVPMTIFALADHHRAVVLELGTSAPGEIAELTRMVRPDLALITLIARAHALGLGSIDAIEAEKCAIFEHLGAHAIALGNADDARVVRGVTQARAAGRVLYGNSEGADYRILTRRSLGHEGAAVTVRRRDRGQVSFVVPLLGIAGALAAAAALAVTEQLAGRPLEHAEIDAAFAALGDQDHDEGRLEPRLCASGLFILDDSYNANPASCRASIEAARELARELDRRLVLVLGEMRELGDASVAEHEQLGLCARESGARVVIAIGGDARHLDDSAGSTGAESRFAERAEEAAELAKDVVLPGDLVLVKGSRGVRTELVVRALAERHGGLAARGAHGEFVAREFLVEGGLAARGAHPSGPSR
ncbi:MAG: UDP-N-acetylmuramoyl-tripeptide--D-alanyl-D-alanine ligase [Myxococcales bacterium]|nr:UDP-N-acetylmuramoyl-tripeptide--D-alanyl-D-alanine ligase [Myxococcales bacterium]